MKNMSSSLFLGVGIILNSKNCPSKLLAPERRFLSDDLPWDPRMTLGYYVGFQQKNAIPTVKHWLSVVMYINVSSACTKEKVRFRDAPPSTTHRVTVSQIIIVGGLRPKFHSTGP